MNGNGSHECEFIVNPDPKTGEVCFGAQSCVYGCGRTLLDLMGAINDPTVVMGGGETQTWNVKYQ